MTDFAEQLNAMPVKYAAQIPYGYSSLSDDHLAHLNDYLSDPHPAKLAILGDRLQEDANERGDERLALIGQLLSRAPEGEASATSPQSAERYYTSGVTAFPVNHFDPAGRKRGYAARIHLVSPEVGEAEVHVPASRDELLALHQHDHANRSDYPQWHADTAMQLYAAPDEDFSDVAWKPRHEELAKLQRGDDEAIRYAAKTKRLRTHPLLRGTRLEIALKTLAKENRGTDVGNLARHALADPTPLDAAGFSVFHLLSDALQEASHPLADKYNWEAVHAKLHLDHHLLEGVKSLADTTLRQQRQFGETRYANRPDAAYHVLHDARRRPGDASTFGDYSPIRAPDADPFADDGLPTIREQLFDYGRRASPSLTEPQFDESLARLHAKVSRARERRDATVTPPVRSWRGEQERVAATRSADENEAAFLAPLQPSSRFDEEWVRDRVASHRAEHYARTPSVGGVKNALRLLRSDNQQRNREVAATVLDRLGLTKTKLRDAITSTRSPVAGIVAAIYHDDPRVAEKAAAWIAHLQQLPSTTVFHVDSSGPDSIYKLRLPLDPVKATSYLESHGITRAVLSPVTGGVDVLVHDPGNRQRDRVEKAAIGAGISDVQHSVGTSVMLGGDSQSPRADATARKAYRDYITK